MAIDNLAEFKSYEPEQKIWNFQNFAIPKTLPNFECSSAAKQFKKAFARTQSYVCV